jgi:hypothetical protein
LLQNILNIQIFKFSFFLDFALKLLKLESTIENPMIQFFWTSKFNINSEVKYLNWRRRDSTGMVVTAEVEVSERREAQCRKHAGEPSAGERDPVDTAAGP